MGRSLLTRRLGAAAIVSATAVLSAGGPAHEPESLACGWCIDGWDASGGVPEHWFTPNGTFWMAGAHSNAAFGGCGQHASCARRASDAELSQISKMLPTLRGDQLRTLSRAHPGQVRYDAEQHMVVLVGTGSHVLARFPVRTDQERNLLAE